MRSLLGRGGATLHKQCSVRSEMACKELSPQQASALEEFSSAVASIANKPDDSDEYYLRWLRARNFNLDKALQMFRNVR